MSRVEKLEITANISIIASAVVFCVVLGHTLVVQRNAREASRPYQPGEQLEQISGLDADRSSATLLLVVRSTCPFCTESMPFYRQLLDQASKAQVRAVALVFERREVGSAYLAANGLKVQKVVAMERPQMSHVKGTPTLILVDKSGRIVNSWIGKLASQEESEVIEAIRRAG